MKLLDTHQHLILREVANYAWSEKIPGLAGANFTLDDYRDLTAGAQISQTIFMEADADDYKAEARHVSKLAARPNSAICGLIASCRPEDNLAFDQWLEESSDLPVVGFRRILHEVSDDMSQSSQFRNNVKKLVGMGKTFDMVFRADQLPIAIEFAQACDKNMLILDHCGVPDIRAGRFEPWRSHIEQLAALPNISCKVSGVLAYCDPQNAGIEAVRPWIEHIFDCFGFDRLVWGSDWPVVNITSSLPDWIEIFTEICSGLTDQEKEAIGYRNAQRIYNVGEP